MVHGTFRSCPLPSKACASAQVLVVSDVRTKHTWLAWQRVHASSSVHTPGRHGQALVDYGGYIVDDTGGGNSAAVCMEAAVNDEMRSAYGCVASILLARWLLSSCVCVCVYW